MSVEAPNGPELGRDRSLSRRSQTIVVLYNSSDCIGSCLNSSPLDSQPIVVENLPGDGSVDSALRIRPEALVLKPGRNLGFGGACNLALRRSSAPFVLLLNPDASLSEDCLDRLVAHLETHPTCGAVGPLVLRKHDGRIDSAGMDVLAPGWTRDRSRGQAAACAPLSGPVGCLSAGVILLRRQALVSIDRFPDAFWMDLFLYNEDVELSFALRRGGWDLHFLSEARAFHAVGGSHPPRRPIRAMAARNRLLTGLVHVRGNIFFHPASLLRWAWRILMDTPRLLDNFRIPELRKAFFPLVAQIPERRRSLRGNVP